MAASPRGDATIPSASRGLPIASAAAARTTAKAVGKAIARRTQALQKQQAQLFLRRAATDVPWIHKAISTGKEIFAVAAPIGAAVGGVALVSRSVYCSNYDCSP